MKIARRLLVASSILVAANVAAYASDSTAALLQKQTQEMADAIAAGGAQVWDRYLDDGVIVTSEDGTVQSKGDVLKGLRPLPEGVSGTIAITEFRAVVHGSTAITNYRMDEHENYHGALLHCFYRTTDTWIETPGGWRLAAEQVLAERGDPPAIRVADAVAAAYVGRYALTPAIVYEIRKNGDALEGRRNAGAWEPLKVEAPDVLFVPGKPRYRKIILRDESGKITGFADRREEWDIVWKRMP